MSAIKTKNLIADTFIDLCLDSPSEKVSVSDIITTLGKNRKTFYYHFVDRTDLIQWIYRRDISTILQKTVNTELLVYPNNSTDHGSDLPYYTFIKNGVRSLDNSLFFAAFGTCLQNRRKFYKNVFSEHGLCSFETYLFDLYLPVFSHDIDFILSNRYLNQENKTFLAEFYTAAFIAYFKHRLFDKGVANITKGMGSFTNIIHSSLEHAIRDQQFNRKL